MTRRTNATLESRPAEPLMALHQVRRDGNPLRRHGHVSPHLGKLGPVDGEALDAIARRAVAVLPPLAGETLVIGLAESSLMLSASVAARLGGSAHLCLSTREPAFADGARPFCEPHSHGASHFLPLGQGARYDQVVIVEDELTTGATLKNLILTLRDVATQFYVLTLLDLRLGAQREELQQTMAAAGLQVRVIDLAAPRELHLRIGRAEAAAASAPFPMGHSRDAHGRALATMHDLFAAHAPAALYMVGECVFTPLAFWQTLAATERPWLQHVTRSPWEVDGEAIRTRLDLGSDFGGTRYFLYNYKAPAAPLAAIAAESGSLNIAERLATYLQSQGVLAHVLEVPRA